MTSSDALRGRTRYTGKIDPKALGSTNIPLYVDGCALWLAAWKESYANATAITTWTDRGPNHKNASGNATYYSSIINNQPAMYFNGSQSMSLGDLSSYFPTAATLFIVASSDDNYNLYTTHTNAESDMYYRYASNGHAYFGPFRTGRWEGWPQNTPGSGNHVWVIKSTSGVGTYSVYIDGISKGTQNTTHAGGTSHALSSAKLLTGYIAEVIVYNVILSNSDTTRITDYIHTRYNLP